MEIVESELCLAKRSAWAIGIIDDRLGSLQPYENTRAKDTKPDRYEDTFTTAVIDTTPRLH